MIFKALQGNFPEAPFFVPAFTPRGCFTQFLLNFRSVLVISGVRAVDAVWPVTRYTNVSIFERWLFELLIFPVVPLLGEIIPNALFPLNPQL
jgi:hypothetical protein